MRCLISLVLGLLALEVALAQNLEEQVFNSGKPQFLTLLPGVAWRNTLTHTDTNAHLHTCAHASPTQTYAQKRFVFWAVGVGSDLGGRLLPGLKACLC